MGEQAAAGGAAGGGGCPGAAAPDPPHLHAGMAEGKQAVGVLGSQSNSGGAYVHASCVWVWLQWLVWNKWVCVGVYMRICDMRK
mmetsp:Transcript_3125/g.6830  ORF Transcript_3125/g.6830 Transcript_3125/m.6830 type:complete len:84 (-) Transcript_3125:673-924(-)